MGVQYGCRRRNNAPDAIGSLDDRLEVHWRAASSHSRGLGTRVRQVQAVPRVQEDQLEYDPGRIQVHLLDGIRTQNVGTRTGLGIWSSFPGISGHKTALFSFEAQAGSAALSRRRSRSGGMVDGQERLAGARDRARAAKSESLQTGGTLDECLCYLRHFGVDNLASRYAHNTHDEGPGSSWASDGKPGRSRSSQWGVGYGEIW